MSTLTDLVHIHYDAINSNDLDRALEIFDENVVTEAPDGTLHGLAPFRAMGEVFLAAAPDQKMTIRHIYEAGDSVIVEGDYAGTHTGPLAAPQGTIPPTGRAFSFPFADVFTVKGGKVVRHAIYWDNVRFMAQLGLMGSPEPANV
jgi:ketosteroid isomerase-like protein